MDLPLGVLFELQGVPIYSPNYEIWNKTRWTRWGQYKNRSVYATMTMAHLAECKVFFVYQGKE
jgi:hypothetical protein